MSMCEFHLADLAATEGAGGRLGCALPDGAVVAVDGPLGAGKTSFTRGLAVGLGVPAHAVASPSFTIIAEHALADGRTLRHMDAWRLSAEDELRELGWFEWAGAPGTLTVVEWASRIETALVSEVVPAVLRLRLDYDGSGRVVSWSAADAVLAALGDMP